MIRTTRAASMTMMKAMNLNCRTTPTQGKRMKATIEVRDRKEAEAIKAGLADPAVRAFAAVMGVLSQLPSDRARARVMHFVTDCLDEQEEINAAASPTVPGSPDK